jgi:LCP family protein required for cell wall assembly
MAMFRVLILILAAGAAAIVAGDRLLSMLVRPGFLLGLLAANLVVLAFRGFSVWDAWRGSGGRAATAGLIVLLVLVAVPHLALGYFQGQGYRLLNSVFGGGSPTTTVAASPSTSGEPGTTSGGVVVTTTTVPPTTTTTIPWEGKERVNILLLGGDSGPGRSGIRTDTMIVASIDLGDGDIAMFGLPRNLSGLEFPDGTEFTAYSGILNEVYPYGWDNPDRYPVENPGAAAIMDMAEGITGLDIDYYVLVNLQAFVKVVDALGGVTIYVPTAVHDDEYPKEDGTTITIDIPAGTQELNGTEALAYVRSRRQSDDYNRMARQRCFLTAVADQADVGSLITALPTLVPVIEENVQTDIPLSALPNLIELGGIVKASDALVVGFGPPDWITGRTAQRYPIPNLDKIHEAVQLSIEDPDEARVVYGLQEAGDACGYGEDSTNGPASTTTAGG